MADTTGRSLQTYLWLASLFVVLQSYKSSTATNEANPFHMKEAYEDIPIQSIDAVEFVDVKHVQTHPDICSMSLRERDWYYPQVLHWINQISVSLDLIHKLFDLPEDHALDSNNLLLAESGRSFLRRTL
ncbi:hypothetical protein EDD18DRAFT_521306 [Armillaria luteobubalina]|uniref:Uncharacterized protein n=1 Tax=Armillaria luteobubalina TaxID=153913 RepID=A0AA39PYL5_9AGAR|nr:hypothetical protein EDD18DRAFT_521306 [Armillaria luteobubalina]